MDPDEVLVDIGYKAEGVIPAHELSIRNHINPDEVVKEGEPIEALVLQMEDDQGRLVLSKKRAQYERAWGRIEGVMNAGGTVQGPVIEVVKDAGLRGRGGGVPTWRRLRLSNDRLSCRISSPAMFETALSLQ